MNIRRVYLLAAIALCALAPAVRAQRGRAIADLQIAPPDAKLHVGERLSFVATAYDAQGTPLDITAFEWSSSNTDVATIDARGTVSGVSIGLAIISVRAGSGSDAKTAQAPVQVIGTGAQPAAPSGPPVQTQRQVAPPSVGRVTLLPGDASLRVGEQRPFLPTALDPAGNRMDGVSFQWSSSNPAVATVDDRGVVTGVAAGLAVINVRAGSGDAMRSAEAPVQVGAAAAPAPAAPVVEAPRAAAPAAPTAAPFTGPLPARIWLADTSSTSSLDFAGMRPAYRARCDGGDAAACANLAFLLGTGRGGGMDMGQARALDQRACDAGDAWGCAGLGRAWETGRGGPQDFGQAHTLYQRACDSGLALACWALGSQYEVGRGVSPDLAQARALYERACEGGEPRGCTDAGFFYSSGRGGRRDDRVAVRLLVRACESGNPLGCNNLGAMYLNGNGVDRDFQRARGLFQRACDGASGIGCRNLGDMHRDGRGMRNDREMARQLYVRACNLGDRPGCERLQQLNGK